MQVPPDALSDYIADGVTVLRGALSAELLAVLAEAIETDIASPGPFAHSYETKSGKFHGNLRLWETNELFRRVIFESNLASAAQQFFGGESPVNLLYDQLFVKEPGTPNATRWHNDQAYWPVDGQEVLSMWIAVDETDLSSGALEFIRGSHKWDVLFQPEQFGATAGKSEYSINPDYVKTPDFDTQRESHEFVSWNLKPGDAYVFQGKTVHGSGGNQSMDRRRRGYTVRFTGGDARYAGDRLGTHANLRNPTLKVGSELTSQQHPLLVRGLNVNTNTNTN